MTEENIKHAGGMITPEEEALARAAQKVQKDIGEQLTQERHKTHGSWSRQSACAQELKGTIRDFTNQVLFEKKLSPGQIEALEMIAVKMSRIICGNPNEPDHWDDIAGYATLGKKGDGK